MTLARSRPCCLCSDIASYGRSVKGLWGLCYLMQLPRRLRRVSLSEGRVHERPLLLLIGCRSPVGPDTHNSTEHMYPCQRFDEVTVPFAPVQASNTLPLTVSRPCRAISKVTFPDEDAREPAPYSIRGRA